MGCHMQTAWYLIVLTSSLSSLNLHLYTKAISQNQQQLENEIKKILFAIVSKQNVGLERWHGS